jgi:outer membrane protein, multidrug efflux system
MNLLKTQSAGPSAVHAAGVRTRPYALAPLALAILTACAPPLRLGEAQPDRLVLPRHAGAAAAELPQDASAVHWRSFFKDERLHTLIEAALLHNRDLRQAAARVEEAKAQWALARAERLPSLNLLGQLQMENTLTDGLSFAPRRRLDLGLATASYEMDFFGRLAGLSEAAKANFLATEEARRATELALIGQVAELYHAQRFTEAALERARSQVTSRVQSLDILEKAKTIGVIDDLETEQAQALLEDSRSQRTQLGHMLNQTQNLLRLLVGPRAAAEDLPAGLSPQQLLAAPAAELGVSADVLLLRPDILAAEQRLHSAQANIKAARAAFFPRVALTASVGTASAGLNGLFSAGAWAFRPSLSLPLFDGGRTQAGLDIAKARELAVIAAYERTVEQAFREVADQLSARHSLAVQASSAQRSLQAFQLRLKIHRQRFEAGMSGYLEVLEAERQALSAEQSLMQLQRAQLEAHVGLYRALGGGSMTQEPAPAPNEAIRAAASTAPQRQN